MMPEEEILKCNRQIAGGSVQTALRFQHPRGAQSYEPGHYCEPHLQELDQVPTASVGEEASEAPPGREEKQPF